MKNEMKTKRKIGGYIIRSVVYAVCFSVALVSLSFAFQSRQSVLASSGYDNTAKKQSQPRVFSFAERVAYQRAIEDVYWRHRIWPKENPDPKPSLDAVMSQAQLENKVAGYLRDSLRWKITGNGRSLLSNYKPRWTEWPGTQNSRKSCGNCLRLLGTIRLSSLSFGQTNIGRAFDRRSFGARSNSAR